MPELPEVEGLVRFLAARSVGREVASVALGAISALKTVAPGPEALLGTQVVGARRHGKWIDLATTGPHLLVHLSRAGWVRWSDALPTTPVRPGRSPLALRLGFDDGSGFDLTEQGTRKRLAIHVVMDPAEVEQVASLGVDPLSQEFTPDRLAALARARNQQLKGLLRDQRQIAGIGNAYSDEILHAARLSPFAMSARLDAATVEHLHGVIRQVLTAAVDAADGRPAAELKDAKRRGMQVHGRTGAPCPVCGDTVREVSFAESSLQYCPRCQTGGKPLADRRMSRLLK
ncbi:Fpg/Nei family DNA glycosylase [Actinotalea sp.]|uniref:Fpg/Nei family DNA glycosylase n=1 Tax=Actinotalea sp. TaxID=1872145 RepID=UPI003561688D